MNSLLNIAIDWVTRCFGIDQMYDHGTRTLRCAEEIVELAQSLDIPKEKMLQLVEMVYSRPVNMTPSSELGGVVLTTCILCATFGMTPEDVFERELRRVLSKPVAEFAKRNQEKIDLGMKT